MLVFCELCCLNLNSQQEYERHEVGKKHMKYLKFKEFEKRVTERSIFVKYEPFDMEEGDIIQFFLQYGEIQRYKFSDKHLIVEFNESDPVDFLLSNPVYINNTRLDIKRRIFHLDKHRKKGVGNYKMDDVSTISYPFIQSIFNKENTFDEQLVEFLNTVQLTDDDVELRYEAISVGLDNIFKAVFPRCRTYTFGSTKTGLGFKDCDLDIYMDVGFPICSNSSSESSMQKIFKQVKRVMYRSNYFFSDIIPISTAKIPIIKFRHVATNISCDISFKNGFGIYNSCLIKHCVSLDNRLKPLMIIIKYWARECNVSGCGKIPNYALIMLIIFYLQQSPRILPSLMEFQATCKPQIINGWQVNFDETFRPTQNTNKCSVPELLHGFFKFYNKFEFKTYVISTLDGIAHTKLAFADVNILPEHMFRYKACAVSEDFKLGVNKPICIQDPIELNRNVTAHTPRRFLELFQLYCEIAAGICESSSSSNYKDLFKNLFTKPIKEDNKMKFLITVRAGNFLQIGLPNDFQTRRDIVNREQYVKDNWYKVVFNIITDIFLRVFRLQVEILSADKEGKHQKIEVLSDVHTKEHKELLLRCVGDKSVWRNRNSVHHFVIDTTLSRLDKEALISEKVIEDQRIIDPNHSVDLNFICKFERKQSPVRFLLTLTNKSCDRRVFRELEHFVKNIMSKTVEDTLMHMQQFEQQ